MSDDYKIAHTVISRAITHLSREIDHDTLKAISILLAARHAVKPMKRAAVLMVLFHALDHVARTGIDPGSDDALELLMRACMSVME